MQNQIFRKVSVERLSSPEQLDQLMTITSPRGWISLLGVFCLLAVLVLWGIFGTITTKIEANGIMARGSRVSAKGLQAVLYLPFNQGKQVSPGMKVQIASDKANSEQGFVWGRVTSVSPYPVSDEEMYRSLGNKGLIKLFGGQGTTAEIRVKLITATKNHYQSLSEGGAKAHLQTGELCTAIIITKQQKPIELFLPLHR